MNSGGDIRVVGSGDQGPAWVWDVCPSLSSWVVHWDGNVSSWPTRWDGPASVSDMHRGVLVPSTNMSQLASQSDSFAADWSSLYVCSGSSIQPQPDQQPPRCPPLRCPPQPVAYVLVSHATHTFSIVTWLSFSTISSVCLRCLYILESCSHISSSLILDSTWNMGNSVSSVGKHATTHTYHHPYWNH